MTESSIKSSIFTFLVLATVFGLSGPGICPVFSGQPGGADSATTIPRSPGLRDLLVIGAGTTAAGVGRFVWTPDTREIPPEGLNREDISLAWDRNSIDSPNPGALGTSNALLGAALVTPTFLNLAIGGSDWNTRLHLWTLQTKSMAVTAGAVYLLKGAVSRPRPYTYLSESRRGSDPATNVTEDDAFASFPSGHAAMAWASSLSGLSFLVLEQPELPGWVHFLGGVLAGGVATSTSLLRVEGAQHFPSDVAAGALLGGATGVTVALLDRGSGRSHSAPGHAWRNGLLGLVAGTAVAFLVTPPTSPWID